jgi:hypothetical protein
VLLPPNAPIATDRRSLRESWAALLGKVQPCLGMSRYSVGLPFRDLNHLGNYPVQSSDLAESQIQISTYAAEDRLRRHLVVADLRLESCESPANRKRVRGILHYTLDLPLLRHSMQHSCTCFVYVRLYRQRKISPGDHSAGSYLFAQDARRQRLIKNLPLKFGKLCFEPGNQLRQHKELVPADKQNRILPCGVAVQVGNIVDLHGTWNT